MLEILRDLLIKVVRPMRSRAFPAAVFSLLLAVTFYQSAGLVCAAADTPETSASEKSETVGETAVKPSANGFFAVYVSEAGQKRKVMVKGGTVADVLEQIDVIVTKYDKPDMPLNAEVKPGDVITITRVRYNTVDKRKTMPYSTIAAYSPGIEPGKETVLVEGEDGVQIQKVRQTIVNDVVTEEEVREFIVEKEPVARKVVKGFPVKPVSQYDFGYEFDENCEPIGYTSVMRECKSAGYSAPAGSSTASGRKAVVGNVAVDPDVIPYGTKLFIKSSDGKHIYGYAIAADTGIALKDGRIDVDLLYATYAESARNGIRKVDIFILGDVED